MSPVEDSEKCQQVLAALKAFGDLSDSQLEYADEPCLKRYLRARAGDVKKAAKLLHDTLVFRVEMQVDTLTAQEFEEELKLGKMYVAGNDNQGRTIMVTRKRDAALRPDQFDHYFRHLVFTAETCIRNMQNNQEKWVWIMDMKGYQRKNSPALSVSRRTISILSDHYPERLHRCYIVDAPALFSILWTAVSPFIDPVTKQKIVFVYTKDYEKELQALEQGHTLTLPSDLPEDAFLRYLEFYGKQYNEEKFKRLLSQLWEH